MQVQIFVFGWEVTPFYSLNQPGWFDYLHSIDAETEVQRGFDDKGTKLVMERR